MQTLMLDSMQRPDNPDCWLCVDAELAIDTVGVLTSTGSFQNFGLLDQVKLVYLRDQQANLIILSHQARQEQLGAKKMEK